MQFTRLLHTGKDGKTIQIESAKQGTRQYGIVYLKDKSGKNKDTWEKKFQTSTDIILFISCSQ
jgi:hypothetical protein